MPKRYAREFRREPANASFSAIGYVNEMATTRLTAGDLQRTSTSVGPQRWQTSFFRPRM